jgi:NADH:ubiquinone oxidoreductase subunit 3 (subunit A)
MAPTTIAAAAIARVLGCIAPIFHSHENGQVIILAMPVLETGTLLGGALSLMGALAVNDAVKISIESAFPPAKRNSPKVAVIYAMVVTLFVIFTVIAINICSHHAKSAFRNFVSLFGVKVPTRASANEARLRPTHGPMLSVF